VAPPQRKTDEVLRALRALGLTFPGVHLKSPWPGHADLAVNDKTFAYLSIEGEPCKISCKLPHSGSAALSLPFTEPTAYGLGKSGWVTATFDADESPPLDLFREWIEESYRAQAPRKLSAQLAASTHAPATTREKNAPRKIARADPSTRSSARKPAKAARKRSAH
jgi:predicted DNA-binding protein (MmcQ/YjbR family)